MADLYWKDQNSVVVFLEDADEIDHSMLDNGWVLKLSNEGAVSLHDVLTNVLQEQK